MISCKLNDLCSLVKGKQIDTTLLDRTHTYKYINGGIKESGYYNDYNTEGDTIIISEGGASCGFVNYISERFWLGCHCYKLENPSINKKYLYYLLKANQNRIMELRTGAAMPNIKKASLCNLQLRLTLDEKQQKLVTRLLDAVEKSISISSQILVSLDELIKSRFIEMFGDPVDDCGKWPLQTLEHVCRTIVDCPHSTPNYTDEKTGFMCIRTSVVKKNQIIWDDVEYISEQEYLQRIKRKRPEKGDIIYTREGAILGIAAIIDHQCNVALGQRSMLLSPDKDKCLSEFLCTAMNFESFLLKALRGLNGSASPHINVKDIKMLQIALPPLNLQEQFVKFAKQVDKSKLVIKKSLSALEELKGSLMQKYFFD